MLFCSHAISSHREKRNQSLEIFTYYFQFVLREGLYYTFVVKAFFRLQQRMRVSPIVPHAPRQCGNDLVFESGHDDPLLEK
jgi:hypothetical protein